MAKAETIVTVFTPTYNRAHLLTNLYESLKNQTCQDFEWLIIDDGSTDNTEIIIKKWIKENHSFPIRYYKVQNGGKMRAINHGALLAHGEYFCGIDSDDWFFNNAISSIIEAFISIKSSKSIAGSSFSKNEKSHILAQPEDCDYIDTYNFCRKSFGLEADTIMVFYTEIMRKYHIPVWTNEKFTPESVFLDQMALDGYKMRYYSKAIYGGEYLNDGLTTNSWRLLRDNPMGYAMMYNIHMQYHKGVRHKLHDIIQFISCCCIKGEYLHSFKCHYSLCVPLLFLPGYVLAQRRKRQFKKYCPK